MSKSGPSSEPPNGSLRQPQRRQPPPPSPPTAVMPEETDQERLRKLTPAQIQQLHDAGVKEICRRHFRDFIPYAWKQVEPATPFVNNWHIDCIAEHLQAQTDGQIQNLLINMPPRCMKSLAVAVFWPAWEWSLDPTTRWLFT